MTRWYDGGVTSTTSWGGKEWEQAIKWRFHKKSSATKCHLSPWKVREGDIWLNQKQN